MRRAGQEEPGAALRLADLATFLAIVQCESLSGAARSLGVTPSQVSKAMARLERQLDLVLLERGAKGALPSAMGRKVAPEFEAILRRLQRLRELKEPPPELTLVGASFVNQHFIPQIVRRLPSLRLRSLELPPGLASAYASVEFFDVAVTPIAERWPVSWDCERVGELRRALFASPRLAKRLGRPPLNPDQLRDIPFICPIYGYNGQVLPGDDACPLPRASRRLGCEVQTALLALELARHVDQLVFAPAIAALPFVRRRELVELPVSGWDVRDVIYLACHGQRVRSRVQREILDVLRGSLDS
ncbi:MAG TPA: LysR family transcriptional regulator [Myxococcales bacterium]|nr:LysR family transcriptional regulator [Myxococcales bacterium]